MKQLIDLIKMGSSVVSKQDFCRVFKINSQKIHYLIYKYPENKRYKTFHISKKNGGSRLISTPIFNIKKSQQKLLEVIEEVYTPKKTSFAYIKDQNIKSHAKFHLDKSIKCLLRIDIKDFFPTIHFGRVLGIFMKPPFSLNKDVAIFLANLTCYQQKLPQGSPTSPLLSDLVCRRLDNQLRKLAKEAKCFYTRYADDIYFSTKATSFSKELIGILNENNKGFNLSKRVIEIFKKNDFNINEDKVRFMSKSHRQTVTGIVINKKLTPSKKYIKLIRAMLHIWETKGLKFSQKYFEGHYNKNKGGVYTRFENLLLGRITYLGYIRGWDDRMYLKYAKRLSNLYEKENLKGFKYTLECKDNKCKCRNTLGGGKHILPVKNALYTCKLATEGKTDLSYLQSSLSHFHQKGEYLDLQIEFDQSTSLDSDSKLKTYYNARGDREKQEITEICLFDNDSQISSGIKNSISINSKNRDRKFNCFPLITPIPKHRESHFNFCIELYFQDKDLCSFNKYNHRIYLREEFNDNGEHNEISNLKINPSKKNIIVEEVFDLSSPSLNIAMSKENFSKYIQEQASSLDNIDFSGFKVLFDEIICICKNSISK